MKRYPDPDSDQTEAESTQQWNANLMPYKAVYKQQHDCIRRLRQAIQLTQRPVLMQNDTMAGKFMDPCQVEKGRFAERSRANKHKTHELVKDDGARGVPAHASWVMKSHADW